MADLDKHAAPANKGSRRPTALDERIGRALRERRQVLNLRIEDLARRLSIAPHQLQKYETGGNRITASRLVECAQALDVPVAWFYRTAGVPHAAPTSLTTEETTLIELFRGMDAEARNHLIGIGRLLNSKAKADQHTE